LWCHITPLVNFHRTPSSHACQFSSSHVHRYTSTSSKVAAVRAWSGCSVLSQTLSWDSDISIGLFSRLAPHHHPLCFCISFSASGVLDMSSSIYNRLYLHIHLRADSLARAGALTDRPRCQACRPVVRKPRTVKKWVRSVRR